MSARRELHVASLVVQAAAARLEAIAAGVGELAGTEIHGQDPAGKLIVVLEAASEAQVAARMAAIRELPGVLGTALVLHQFEQVRPGQAACA